MAPFWRRAPNVERQRRRGDVDGLKRALEYRDPIFTREGVVGDFGVDVRVAAAAALGEIRGSEATDALAGALDDPEPNVRLQVIESLTRIGVRPVEDRLMLGIVSWNLPDYRGCLKAALDALVSADVTELPERFALTAAEGPSPVSEDRHGRALGRILASDVRGPEAAACAVTARLLPLGDGVSSNARRQLEWLAPVSVPVLFDALGEADYQRLVLELLGSSHDSGAVNRVSGFLNHTNALVAAAAARSLGEIRDTTAVPALIAATQDQRYAVREAAGDALDALGSAGVIAGVSATLDRLQLEGGQASDERTPQSHASLAWAERLVTRLIGPGQASAD